MVSLVNITVTMATADLCRSIEAVIDFNNAAGSDDSALEVVLGTKCIISRKMRFNTTNVVQLLVLVLGQQENTHVLMQTKFWEMKYLKYLENCMDRLKLAPLHPMQFQAVFFYITAPTEDMISSSKSTLLADEENAISYLCGHEIVQTY